MINGTAARKLAQTASTAGARYVFFFLRKWIRLGTNELLLLQMNWARMRANQRHTMSLITGGVGRWNATSAIFLVEYCGLETILSGNLEIENTHR